MSTAYFLCVLVALCSTQTADAADINSGDKAVLQILYDETDGPNGWINKWNFTSDICGDYYGVTCDANGERVTELDLTGNNLIGGIPRDIGNLTELTKLGLGNNYLTGEIPREFGYLTNLLILLLSLNSLTGEIPREFGNLTGLEDLFLSFNQLTGDIPRELADMAPLYALGLQENCFSCPVPDAVIDLCATINSDADAGACILGDCGDCCAAYLPGPPVGDCIDTTYTPSCDDPECVGCTISCKDSNVTLTCINSDWTAPIQADICEDTRDCTPNPCINGGSCVSDMNGFECTCPDGFMGPTCAQIDECAAVDCKNGGTCYGGVCCCIPGFIGMLCEINDNSNCNPNPCLHGVCTAADNDFSCECDDGYEGNTCGSNTNDCANDPCINGGRCYDGNNTFSCCCGEGFGGDTCELSPCKQPYYTDPYGKTAKREWENCANSHLVKAKKERYARLISDRRTAENYATLTHVASLSGSGLVGAAIGIAVMKWMGRR